MHGTYHVIDREQRRFDFEVNHIKLDKREPILHLVKKCMLTCDLPAFDRTLLIQHFILEIAPSKLPGAVVKSREGTKKCVNLLVVEETISI